MIIELLLRFYFSMLIIFIIPYYYSVDLLYCSTSSYRTTTTTTTCTARYPVFSIVCILVCVLLFSNAFARVHSLAVFVQY